MTTGTTRTGLYIEIEAAAGAGPRLDAALAVAPVQAVLIRPRTGAAFDNAAAHMLIEQAQARGCAALLERDARLARTLRADGVHLPWGADIIDAYGEAREILGTRYIVGAMAGGARHDAMTLAEAGADYVAFGLPPEIADPETAIAERLALVDWWAEIFEIPCVAFGVSTPALATDLARAGADFVGIPLPPGDTQAAIAERIRAVLLALGRDATSAKREPT